MPIVEIHGKAVEFPDDMSGADLEMAVRSAADQMKPPSGARKQLEAKLPKGASMEERTGMQNFWAGAGKAAVDTGFGLKQLGAVAGNAVGLVDDSTVEGMARDAAYRRERDAPLMDTGAGMVGNVVGNIGMLVAGGLGMRAAGAGATKVGAASAGGRIAGAGGALMNPTTVKGAAAGGAALAATQPATSVRDKVKQVAIGGAAGAAGQKVAQGIGALARGGSASVRPEVKALADRAKRLGIDIRADQIVKSKALNAISEQLDYIPLSGATAAKEAQQKQFNTAVSKTIGEVSDNPAEALRAAGTRLGREFDDTLRNNSVMFDDALQGDLSAIVAEASDTMSDQQFSIVRKQVDTLLNKAAAGNGSLDGQAAYAIKKKLDLIGKSSDTTTAHYAREMKRALMEGLNRSLGPEKAAQFASTRRQYANMIELEKLVPRGAEADISAARLANARGVKTGDLRELQDIAATFLKPREGNSGTAPRLVATAGLAGGLPAMVMAPVTTSTVLAGGMTVGRGSTAALNSAFLREYAMNGMSPMARSLLAKARAASVALPATAVSYQSQGQ